MVPGFGPGLDVGESEGESGSPDCMTVVLGANEEEKFAFIIGLAVDSTVTAVITSIGTEV